MLFLDIVDEENSHIEALRKSGANGNCISQKLTDELKMVYNKEMVSSDGKSFSILGNVKLRIRFEVSGKEERSMEPSEFKVLGSNWTGPDLIIDTSSTYQIRLNPNFQEPCLFAIVGQILAEIYRALFLLSLSLVTDDRKARVNLGDFYVKK
ncbi:2718_t:CDS:2 [Funneliformis geosporum]|nr:2718_t:CDS:2 [Funneliformis geosporum]